MESEKGNSMLLSKYQGKVTKILIEEDDDVSVGQEVIELDTSQQPTEPQQTKQAEPEPEKTPETPTESKPTPPKQPKAPTPAPSQPKMSSTSRSETREKMSRMRKTIAKRLKES